jgi:hypothetical protein
MAKDPAFLFYDGDAARDVSHMNRLERGCYFDFIQAQKKFGPLSLDRIKKILGKDFEDCWPSLQMCLTYEEDTYIISWLQFSIEKRQKYSEGRAKNRKGQKDSKNETSDATYVNHMVNANAIINTSKELCKIFGKEYQAPQERMPAEANWFGTIEGQATEILTVLTPAEAISQIQAYIRYCKANDRKLIGRNYKSSETILSSNWLELLGENKSRAPTEFINAEVDLANLTREAWEKIYAWDLTHNEAFKKYFNGKLSPNQPVGSQSKSR